MKFLWHDTAGKNKRDNCIPKFIAALFIIFQLWMETTQMPYNR
jgi:hypothetical protein